MVNYEKDYIWGEAQQKKIIPYLKKAFGDDLILTLDRWSKYDACNHNINMEIKSRKNSYSAYPTTLLTMNKISDLSKKNIFIFNFVYDMNKNLSEIYAIEYDKKQFDTYEKRMFSRANQSWDEKEYVYIPIEDLTFIYKEEDQPEEPDKLLLPKRVVKKIKEPELVPQLQQYCYV